MIFRTQFNFHSYHLTISHSNSHSWWHANNHLCIVHIRCVGRERERERCWNERGKDRFSFALLGHIERKLSCNFICPFIFMDTTRCDEFVIPRIWLRIAESRKRAQANMPLKRSAHDSGNRRGGCCESIIRDSPGTRADFHFMESQYSSLIFIFRSAINQHRR